MGCCSSQPTETEPTRQDGVVPPRIRQASQAITSETAINHTSHDRHLPTFEPTSASSFRQSETSHSAISTPRPSSTNHRNRAQSSSLAEHYNIPLKPPKIWNSTTRSWTPSQLKRERYEFFETRVTGRNEIWNALRQVAECIREDDISTAQGILDAIGVTLPTGRLEDGCYDEVGNLYRLPEAVLKDPTNVVSENDSSVENIHHETTESKDRVTEDSFPPNDPQLLVIGDSPLEKSREDKGKAAIEKDALKVKCRLSDRGGPDVIVLLGRTQAVRILSQRIRDEGEVPDDARIKIAYLGRILNENETLTDQGWKEGHVINALVVGVLSN